MAIATEFIDFIVPIEMIRKKYPGGWDQCLKDHETLLWGRVWHDKYLFRDGAMNPMDMQDIVKRWEKMGFQCFEEREGKKYWKDMCVFEGMLGGVAMRCDWLEVDRKNRAVFLKGTEAGEVACRDSGDEDF